MIEPALTYTLLSLAILLGPLSIITLLQIKNGSKSIFAYSLVFFTFADALNALEYYFIFKNSKKVDFDYTSINVLNGYADIQG